MLFSRKRLVLQELFSNYQIYLDKTILVCGWIENIRKQGENLCFIRLVDGSIITSLQIIVNKTIDNIEQLDNIIETSLKGMITLL